MLRETPGAHDSWGQAEAEKRYKELAYTLWQLVGNATERNHVAQALLCRTGTAIAIQRAETNGENWHAEQNGTREPSCHSIVCFQDANFRFLLFVEKANVESTIRLDSPCSITGSEWFTRQCIFISRDRRPDAVWDGKHLDGETQRMLIR